MDNYCRQLWLSLSGALCVLSSEQLSLTELKVVVLSIWCSSLGPNGWWRVCRMHCALCGRKESDEPATDAREATWAVRPLSSDRGPKIHGSVSADQKRKNSLNGRRLCKRLIADCHHRVFHLVIKASSQWGEGIENRFRIRTSSNWLIPSEPDASDVR